MRRYAMQNRNGEVFSIAKDEDAPAGCQLVAVIPFEDREQVERFGLIRDEMYARLHPDEYDSTPGIDDDADTDLLQAALREFANPTPPKPDEPTGLGAVVEDAEGNLWVRTDRVAQWSPIRGIGGDRVICRLWSEIAAVRVLSEGIQ